MSMLIRSALLSDISKIRALEAQADSAAHWRARDYDALFSPDAPKRIALVADNEGQIDGFIIARRGADELEIENVVVAANRRREGIGRDLVRRVLGEAGSLPVLLEVRQSNAAARQLYLGLGFAEIGRRTDYYREPPEDALVLRFSPENFVTGVLEAE
jgi:ribosomal-protein-alanine N-acetyltransferase